MKKYIDQFYNEGLATTLYLKPVQYINKKVKNKKIAKFLDIVVKIIYTLLVLGFAVWAFLRMI